MSIIIQYLIKLTAIMQVWCGSEMPEETFGNSNSLHHLLCFSGCVMTYDASPLPLTPLRKGDFETQSLAIRPFYLAIAERINRDKQIKDIPFQSI
jgi:hypothetical protein